MTKEKYKNKKMRKDKQTNIWDKIPETETDKEIIQILHRICGLTENEIITEINKQK